MNRWVRRTAGATVVGIAAALCGAIVAPAPASADCHDRPFRPYEGATTWSQRLVDPTLAWPLTKGAGVVVAVVGTGVDASNAQFAAGQVVPGPDVLTQQPTTVDCDGRGTAAAGIVAAKPNDATTFVGVAPDAKILAIRYTQNVRNGSSQVHPDRLAAAVSAAVSGGAKVVCVVAPAAVDSPALRNAVKAAYDAGVVVVSPAAANVGGTSGVSYPTTSPYVLAVGAIAEDGDLTTNEVGDHIDVVAPGDQVVTTAPGSGRQLRHAIFSDPAAAAAYVAGTVALVRAYRPKLSPAQVMERVRRTATRAVGDRPDPQFGWGVVNPYAAVTAEGVDSSPSAAADDLPTAATPADPTAGVDVRAQISVAVAVSSLGLAALLGLGVQVYRRGRDRGWQSTRRSLADYTPTRDRK